MIAKLLEYDPVRKIRRDFHYDPATDEFVVETRQEVEALTEQNKALHNATDERVGWKGDWHRVASLPLNVHADLQRRGLFDRGREKDLKRWLNDRDNLAFRTRPGRV